MRNLDPKLTRLFVIKGVARALAPIMVLWGIFDWWWVGSLHAAVFAALTFNYVIVYVLTWVAPQLLNGPWRVRAWQTFVLLINAVALPIVFNNACGRLPWGFIAIVALFFVGLYVSTTIHYHLAEKLPMATHFAHQKTQNPSEPVRPRTG